MEKIMKQLNSKNTIGNIILGLYLILNLIYYRFSFGNLVDNLVLLAVNGLGFLGFILFWEQLKRREVLIFTGIIAISSLMSLFVISNYNWLIYLTSLRYLGIVFILLTIQINQQWLTVIMAGSLALFIPVFYNRLGYNLFVNGSQNYHSILLMLVNFIYNMSYWQDNKKASIIPTLIATLIAFLSGGRSPILAYTIFIIGSVIANYSKQKPRKRLITRATMIFLAVAALLLSSNVYMVKKEAEIGFLPFESLVIKHISDKRGEQHPSNSTIETEKSENKINSPKEEIRIPIQSKENEPMLFEQGLASRARVNMIKNYISGATKKIEYLLFGFPLRESPYIVRFNLNPHNSFLRLHSSFGLLGTLLITVSLIITSIKLIITKNFGILILFMGILFRVLTDIAAFPGNLDIVIYYIILYNHPCPKTSGKSSDLVRSL